MDIESQDRETSIIPDIEQEKGLYIIGCIFLSFVFGSIIFLTAITIVLSLIPIYLSNVGTNINATNDFPSISYQAIYATNFENPNQLKITGTSVIPTSLRSQMHLSASSHINIISWEFLSSNKRKKRDTCDYDTNGLVGDQYRIHIEITDLTICHTLFCLQKFKNQMASKVKKYSALTLPFLLSNGSIITISMMLCNFERSISIAPNCQDNIQNQDETDVDCGGLTCAGQCNANQICRKNSDCNDATCVMGTCSDQNATILAVCELINQNISSVSELFYSSDSSLEYNESISHYSSSSTIRSICSVEPGSVDDVSMILKIIGQYRVPFAVKGGGHAANPGFSSTIGVHISMNRFEKVIYHSDNQTVDVGSGLIWDDVYEALEPYNVSVVGGRISGVGVAGLALGGGYSWKSNQYGLCIDNIFEYELVTPNGTIVYVNSNSYPDIFFGLKGGFNNFGIVTNFNMLAVPQTQVYAGYISYIPSQFTMAIQALANFQVRSKDPKAEIVGFLAITGGQFFLSVYCFYDAPIAPNGTFDEFISAPHTTNTLQTQSYLSFVQSTASAAPTDLRTRINTVAVTNLSITFLDRLVNHLINLNSTLGSKTGVLLGFLIEPLVSTFLDNSKGGAYPHVASSTPLFPIGIQFGWESPSDDDIFVHEIKSTYHAVLQIALNDGQNVGDSKQIRYPNYAIDDTPLSQMYGDNVAKLQSIRKAWDPNNIMYLTGGFKF